jgi:hypothetical protein
MGQNPFGATFQERHLSGSDKADASNVDVEQGHRNTDVGQGHAQRQANVPTAADDTHRRFHLKKSFLEMNSPTMGRSSTAVGRGCQSVKVQSQ